MANLLKVGLHLEGEGQASRWDNVTLQLAENHCKKHSEDSVITARHTDTLERPSA